MDRFHYLSFLTDYGLEDGFVAACHGVSARIAPHADVIDVTHLIPPGDIRRGAAVLAQTVPYLPAAVHVAVVDPGVGTARRGIAVAAGDSVFIGPDNGLLSWAVTAAGGAARAFSLTNRELWLTRVTPTFHGRDIFMPVAAHLAADADLAAAGEEIDVAGLATLPAPERMVRNFTAAGEVLTVDRFGNVQLSVTAADAAEIGLKPGGTVLVRLGHRRHSAGHGRSPSDDAALPGDVRRGGGRRACRLHGQRGTGLRGRERRERGPAAGLATGRADIDHGDTPNYSSMTHSTHGDRVAR